MLGRISKKDDGIPNISGRAIPLSANRLPRYDEGNRLLAAAVILRNADQLHH